MEYNRFSTSGNFSIQEHVTPANFWIYILELFFCFIAIPVNIIFAVILFRTSTIHRNLRILLISTCTADSLYALSRYLILIPLLIAYLYNQNISSVTYCWLAKSFHHWVLAAPGVTFFVVILERTLASYLYRNYETDDCYQMGFILTGVQWTYALIVVVANQVDMAANLPNPYSRLPCQTEYSTSRCIFFFVGVAVVLNIIAVFLFFKVVKFNRTLFRQRSWKLKNLTETYQICENVKSLSLLLPVLVVMLIGNVITIILVSINSLVYLAVRETPEKERIAFMTQITGRGNEIAQSYDIAAILSKIAFCYAIRSHPELYKRWRSMFCRVRISPKTDRIVTGVDGTKLTFTVILVLLLIGVVENVVLIGAVLSTSCLHLNLRILLCNCCLGFILMALGRSMIAVPLCISHLNNVDVSSHAWCYVANAVHHSSADSVCLSFVFIMLERTAGTIWSKDYEKTRIHVFPCIFALLQWLIPMSMILGNFLDRDNRMQVFLDYPHLPCQIEYLTPTMFLITMALIFAGFIASIVKNIKKYTKREIWFTNVNLSERYQISENIRSTHFLFPLLTLMLIFSTLSVSVLVYGSYWVGVMTKEPSRFEEVVKWFGRGAEAAQLFDLITAVYTISFPICAFKCHPNLYRRLRRAIGWNSYAIRPLGLNEMSGFEMATAPIRTQTEYHFQELGRLWNS
ncbi:unnamed protein product [Caenorhabditis sp. 36 PRJEB53466]|nr:unnamed protein product [Caenorhabditis sp. 36 PRJEB53466]